MSYPGGYWAKWQDHAGIRRGDRVTNAAGLTGSALEDERPHGDAILVRWDGAGTAAVDPLDLAKWIRLGRRSS